MAEEVKFTEEEMKSIDDIQKTYVGLQNAFGRLGVSRIRLEQETDNLNKAENDIKQKYLENQTNERNFVDGITKKYGDGQLNIETGTFLPSAEEKTEEKAK